MTSLLPNTALEPTACAPSVLRFGRRLGGWFPWPWLSFGSLGVVARMDQHSINEILLALVIGVALCAGVVLFYRRAIARADTILQHWAARNGFEVLHSERCFASGAFSLFTTSRNQIVYFVRVRDREHHERSGWVRCGSFASFIFFSDEADVKWQEAQ